MASIVYWHTDKNPTLSVLSTATEVRASDGSTVSEKTVCEGQFKREWYPCILLHMDKQKSVEELNAIYMTKVGKALIAEGKTLSLNIKVKDVVSA